MTISKGVFIGVFIAFVIYWGYTLTVAVGNIHDRVQMLEQKNINISPGEGDGIGKDPNMPP